MTDLLTTNEIRGLLHVDRTTIYRMVENGRLPAIRVGKQWRFPRAEIERWLRAQAVSPAPLSNGLPAEGSAAAILAAPALGKLLPQPCSQLIQDALADFLGVMMVIADMGGRPVTRVSNPCGFYAALTRTPEALSQCVRTWQQLAANPSIEPKFFPSEMRLLCARGLIRVGSELKGMVIIGGVAPEAWPPNPDQIAALARAFGVEPGYVIANADAVYRLDKPAQEKLLRAVQRIADIFSHIAEDRNLVAGRLQAIAALTAL
jgi:excisionase family DNA binding protein